ncbi:DUF4113 domain-containing protein [Pseudomonas oryzihabitans]|uniref:DUF4113 domain-containing protein n=1 Tax=Pseudomonas oryzihabitans TaxID=47885 RepID=UPI00094252A0|nr:DUF4113 domain-containing protein [Pseudomonas psychrotolerans]
MQVVDRINARYGRAALHVGRVLADPGWQMRRELLSRGYTTRWGELPRAGQVLDRIPLGGIACAPC